MGPMGPMGPKGDKGDTGANGVCNHQIFTGGGVFPPGGEITVPDPRVNTDTIILIQYVEISNGNTAGVVAIGNGWVRLSGSPNKPFQYVGINNLD